jgi:tRNA threonylcarbamoyladenosine biosynthesis protein TsaE
MKVQPAPAWVPSPVATSGNGRGSEWRHLSRQSPRGEGTQSCDRSDCCSHTLTIHSHSEDETRAFGMRLVQYLQGGELIGLVGELGAGKTCLVRGLAEGLGVAPQKVRSPTFTLVNEYSGGRLPLYHIDLYRLVPSPVDRMALRDYVCGSGVCVVEWFERLGEEWPHLRIELTFVGANERALVARSRGAQYDALIDRLREG